MLKTIVDWVLYTIFSLDPATRLAQSIHFFIYDSIKILILVFFMIAIIGYIRTYLPAKKVKAWLTKKGTLPGHISASLFGSLTPFCSCSSIPMFLGFLESGVPLGISFSFLITSPLVNEYLVVIMLGYFGWKITALYVVSGILVGIFAGFILGKMGLEKHLVKDLFTKNSHMKKEVKYEGFKERISFGINEASKITKKLWIWVLVGVGIGAMIHNYVPQELIQSAISKTGFLTVPIAVLLGIPMYGSCVAIVPIAVVLFQKGIPLGTALAFMMATSALSLPEAVILRRAMNLRLILIFFGIVALGIVLTGYLFNILQVMF